MFNQNYFGLQICIAIYTLDNFCQWKQCFDSLNGRVVSVWDSLCLMSISRWLVVPTDSVCAPISSSTLNCIFGIKKFSMYLDGLAIQSERSNGWAVSASKIERHLLIELRVDHDQGEGEGGAKFNQSSNPISFWSPFIETKSIMWLNLITSSCVWDFKLLSR